MLLWYVACKTPEVAPRDLDQILHDTWVHYDAQDDDALAADMRDLRAVVDESTPSEGTFSDITDEEVALAGLDREIDAEGVLGMYTIGTVGCTPDEMERILLATNQDELYEGNYTSYQRDYTSSLDDFTARVTPHLSWDTTYAVDIPLFGAYTADIAGGMHYTPDGGDGPYLFSRTIMPEPADGEPDTVVFDVDLQIEALYPHDGGMVHLFGMWRHIALAGGFGTDSDGSVQLILDGLHDFDDDTTAICDEGRI